MIKYIVIEQNHMHEKIIAITGRFASLYVYDNTIKVQDYYPCRELLFLRNITQNYIRGPDGWHNGVAQFEEDFVDAEAIARGKALADLDDLAAAGMKGFCWSQLEYDSFAEYPNLKYQYVPCRDVDSLPFIRCSGRGRAALDDIHEYLNGNWSDPPLPWDLEKEIAA